MIADCYERRSVIVTSNLEFGEWNQILGDNRLTAALMDRSKHVLIPAPGQTTTKVEAKRSKESINAAGKGLYF